MLERNSKILVVGGGTAGHSKPAWQVAKKLKQLDYEVYFVSDDNKEWDQLCNKANIHYLGINSGKLLRSAHPKYWINNSAHFIKTAISIQKLYFQIKRIKPKIIFAKGGFVSFPVCFVARSLRIPLILHESDSVLGLTNQIFSGYAKKICVSFEKENFPYNLNKKLVYTGIPLQEKFTPSPLPDEMKKILIFGGSQGSEPINRMTLGLVKIISPDYQITWITGKNNYKLLKEKLSAIENKLPKIKLIDFSNEIDKLIKENFLVISRSGATSIYEISAIGRPAIFIPFADASRDHQRKNALILKKKNAAYVLEQTATPYNLLKIIKTINKTKAIALVKSIKSFYNKESIDLIINQILNG